MSDNRKVYFTFLIFFKRWRSIDCFFFPLCLTIRHFLNLYICALLFSPHERRKHQDWAAIRYRPEEAKEVTTIKVRLSFPQAYETPMNALLWMETTNIYAIHIFFPFNHNKSPKLPTSHHMKWRTNIPFFSSNNRFP